jgi:phenylacetate-coenzyme A ligase PaaK-like adenylate-forming protein
MRWGSVGAPTRLPALEYAPLADPSAILQWIDGVRRDGRTPHLHTHCSSAVRLCHAAEAAGMRLDGVHLTAASEPTTAARLATIRRTGATCWPQYASLEAGVVGRACLDAMAPDEVHVHEDRLALIQPDAEDVPPGLTAGALLTTSLRSTATALVLLNVSMGDVANLDRRRCGCPLERLGWTLHLRGIRSIEKLTAGGMTFLDTDVIRVLEEVLPGRFGGGPTHYQLVEEEDADGRPDLRLLVHPAVGSLPSEAVTDAFLSAIATGPGAQQVMSLAWRDAGLLRVERRAPHVTASGKILHLHTSRGRSEKPRR